MEYCLIRLNKAYSEPEVQSAMCVQRFDDSLNPAIHTTYRISLRSSSYGKPRDPSLKDIVFCFKTVFKLLEYKSFSSSKELVGFITSISHRDVEGLNDYYLPAVSKLNLLQHV